MFAILVRFELKDQAAANGFDALVEETVSAIQTSEPETLAMRCEVRMHRYPRLP
jgi:hypothetical protein